MGVITTPHRIQLGEGFCLFINDKWKLEATTRLQAAEGFFDPPAAAKLQLTVLAIDDASAASTSCTVCQLLITHTMLATKAAFVA